MYTLTAFIVVFYHVKNDVMCADDLHLHFLFWRYETINEVQINEQIRDKEVRVIDAEGKMIGVLPIKEAQALADEAELDLVKISSPAGGVAVCRIVDFGKYRYEQARREKENKKKQKASELKEVRMSPNIDSNDLNTKAASARKFLEKGDRVKVTLRFRGREMAHMAASRHILEDFAESLADVAVIEKPIKIEGRNMSMVLATK